MQANVEDLPSRRGTASESPSTTDWAKIVFFVVVVISIACTVHHGCVVDGLDVTSRAGVRDAVEKAGVWGPIVFILLFILAEMCHVPSLLFVFVAIRIWGRFYGGLLSWISGVIAVTVTFLVARFIFGQALKRVDYRWLRPILSNIDERPIVTLIICRLLLSFAPWFNMLMALTSIGIRDYIVGTAIGAITPVIILSFLFEWFNEGNTRVLVVAVPTVAVVLMAGWWALVKWDRGDEKNAIAGCADAATAGVSAGKTFYGANGFGGSETGSMRRYPTKLRTKSRASTNCTSLTEATKILVPS